MNRVFRSENPYKPNFTNVSSAIAEIEKTDEKIVPAGGVKMPCMNGSSRDWMNH